jgi:hypothetical protein
MTVMTPTHMPIKSLLSDSIVLIEQEDWESDCINLLIGPIISDKENSSQLKVVRTQTNIQDFYQSKIKRKRLSSYKLKKRPTYIVEHQEGFLYDFLRHLRGTGESRKLFQNSVRVNIKEEREPRQRRTSKKH